MRIINDKKGKIDKRCKEYERLNLDKNYYNVKFNERNGGVKATHKLHHFDPNKGHYEKQVQDILFKKGYKIILEDETTGSGRKTDDTLDNHTLDISTIIGSGKNTVVRVLLHSKSKRANTALLYFPDNNLYSTEKINRSLARFKGQTDYKFKKVVIVVAGDNIIINLKQ